MNAGQKLVELSGLSGSHSAIEHFLAITQGTGTGFDKIIFASQMTVCIEDDHLSVIQRPSELSVSVTRVQTETTQKDKPNRITATTRQARMDVTTRRAELFVVQRTRASVFVRAQPHTISTRRKRIVKQIS